MADKNIYVSGPMRGRPNFNFPLFYTVSALLKLRGWTVFNPAEMDILDRKAVFNIAEDRIVPDSTFTIEDALRRDFSVILGCHAVGVLPGWENSEGACREVGMALDIGLPVYEIKVDTGELDSLLEPDEIRPVVAKRYAKMANGVFVADAEGGFVDK